MGDILSIGGKNLDWARKALATRFADSDVDAWLRAAPAADAAIDLLNDASMMVFLNHAAALDGFPEAEAESALIDGLSRFKNLPIWLDRIWVPVEMDDAGADGGMFIGSAPSLLRELSELQQMSPLNLGITPRGYEGTKPPTLGSEERLSEDDCVRWIWLALRDGAQLAINARTVMW